MTTKAACAWPLPVLGELPADVRERIEEVEAKAGFIPNVFIALSRRPAEFRAFFDYHDALMLKESGNLSKADREMIVVATSAANSCHYCVIAHGALLRIYSKKPLLADQVAVNYRRADIDARERAMLDYAMKVALSSGALEENDKAPLYKQGFDDEDIWDIAGIAAFFGMSNRLANAYDMPPNDEFYSMAR
ncbi:alkylhydroperoxidase [Chromatiales bacterium (ex Bugula neritina AB1)]|nr:alkylhydroperoxidase [Chromatiales bacterium (ex Bugula neritina AB1)]